MYPILRAATFALQLDLSGRGLKKEDFFLKLQTQITLAEVTDLILRDNQFDSFLDCSTNLTSLRTLDLSRNHLQRFFFLCREEYNLQVLNVSHNKLQYIDDHAFNDRIPKLKILDISSNKLSIVNETMLEHFKVLKYLSLANNPINDAIHENAFWNLKALMYLNLSNVSSTYFTAETFKTLTDLSMLDLSNNPVKEIPTLPTNIEELDLSNTRITSLKNVMLPKLRELKMNNMENLKQLCLDDLRNLNSLEILLLTGSKNLVELKILKYDEQLLPHLKQLRINDCGLKTLDQNLFTVINRLPVFDVENNPWHCDCQMMWVHTLFATKPLSQNIRCNTPERYRYRQIRDVPENELKCERMSAVFYPVLWACILLLVVTFILATGFFLLRRPIGQWDIRRKNRDTVTYKNVDESSNDMVRILAVGETVDRNGE